MWVERVRASRRKAAWQAQQELAVDVVVRGRGGGRRQAGEGRERGGAGQHETGGTGAFECGHVVSGDMVGRGHENSTTPRRIVNPVLKMVDTILDAADGDA